MRRDPPVRAPYRDLCVHLAMAFVTPVRRNLGSLPIREKKRRVNLILHLAREDLVEYCAADRIRRTHQVNCQIDRVTGIVIQAATTLVPCRPPGSALGPENHGPVSFNPHMVNAPDDPRVDEALCFIERGYEAVVVTHLVNESLLLG